MNTTLTRHCHIKIRNGTIQISATLILMRGTDNKTCREGAWPSRLSDVFKRDPFFAEAEKWADFDRSLRGRSPTPVKPRISPPRGCEVAFDEDGKGNRHPAFVNPFFATLLCYLNPNVRIPSSLQHFVK